MTRKVVTHVARTGKFNWISLLVGITLITGGFFALSEPAATFLTLAVMLGIAAIVRGLMLVATYYRIRDLTSFKAKVNLVIGLPLIVAGVVFLSKPSFAANVFAYIVAVWFIVDAFTNLFSTGILKSVSTSLYYLSIALNILLLIGGAVLLYNPVIAGLSVSLIIGISLLASGTEYVIFAFCDRRPRVT